ncbi:hypothetical protein K402DRAFT_396641 [Aulographum hederae CBS 113979]|uniref:Pre-rRNA-processing protein RIX1 n=1 Tax=Aulographum hederae CBS 113979 TaxID=1176131 RepID=A0A6G1GRG3_9PEZI|nr:hypothetical protein K402DRAFT_396641 [Aulographum hederae CBS 113979]
MAPTVDGIPQLKAVVYHLTSTPVEKLPHILSHLTQLLAPCGPLLCAQPTPATKDGSEAAALVTKFRARLSSLLKDRTPSGRLVAIVLIKNTIELGGWQILHQCHDWVRDLLGMLSKTDSAASKKLAIVTLTRIFILTRSYPTLKREITTPSLTSFIQICLNSFGPKNSTPDLGSLISGRIPLNSVLESFSTLIGRHPTVFRPHVPHIRYILNAILSNGAFSFREEPGAVVIPQPTQHLSRRLLVQLLGSETKTPTERWGAAFGATISAAHQAANGVFRAVHEEWDPSTLPSSVKDSFYDRSNEAWQKFPDDIGLAVWSGVPAGKERLITVLGILQAFISTESPESVGLKVGSFTDLVVRILSIRTPAPSELPGSASSMRLNAHVDKKEREMLWACLPQIHLAGVQALSALIERFGQSCSLAISGLVDWITWMFETESADPALRTAVYLLVQQILDSFGPFLPKATVSSLSPIVRSCCKDLQNHGQAPPPSITGQNTKLNGNSNPKAPLLNSDNLLGGPEKEAPKPHLENLFIAAYELLPDFLSRLPTQYVPSAIRTLIDRTAIILKHREAMLASTLNPSPDSRSSILPFLAATFPGDLKVEGLLRPRLPALRSHTLIGPKAAEPEDDEDEGDEEGEEVSESVPDAAMATGINAANFSFGTTQPVPDADPLASLEHALRPAELASLYPANSLAPSHTTFPSTISAPANPPPSSLPHAEKRAADDFSTIPPEAKRPRQIDEQAYVSSFEPNPATPGEIEQDLTVATSMQPVVHAADNSASLEKPWEQQRPGEPVDSDDDDHFELPKIFQGSSGDEE